MHGTSELSPLRNVIGASAELDLQHEQKKENGAAVSTKTRRQQQQQRRRRGVAAAAAQRMHSSGSSSSGSVQQQRQRSAAAAALSSSGRVSRNPERERESRSSEVNTSLKTECRIPWSVPVHAFAEKADEV